MKKGLFILLFLIKVATAQVTTNIISNSTIGDTITTYLTIDNCISVGEFDLQIQWNSDSLDFVQLQNYHDNLIGGTSSITDTLNYFNYNWIDIFNGSTGGLNISSGDTLFEMVFIANYNPSQVSLDITVNNFYNLFSSILPSQSNGGFLTFFPAAGQLAIVQAEFFWDNDPGFGNGIAFSALDGNFNQAVEGMLASSISVPTQGVHVLSIRLKDENGAWGNTFSKAIMVNPALSTRDIKIQLGEYFWDTDPGQGAGTTLVAFDGNFNQAIETVFSNSATSSTTSGTASILTYCSSNPNSLFGASTSGAIIENVTLIGDNNDIDNYTGGVGDFYEDYTASMYADITEGESYTVDVTLNGVTNGTGAQDLSGAKVYIDYNIDGVFDPITELVAIIPYRTSLTQGLPELIIFTVPYTGVYGPTAMRVVSQNLSSADATDIGPCDAPTGFDQHWYGATEDYSIVLNAPSGAALPLIYLWSSGETDSITNSLVAGTYTVDVTDANGCVATETVNVGELATISVIADSNQTICFGGEPDGLLATVQGYISGTTYSWSNPSDFNNATISNPVFINLLNLTATTNYIVTVINDSNCTATDSITITVNPLPISAPIWHN